MTEEKEVLLPTSEAELDAFVASITEEYKLPAGEDTYDAIATMILHLKSHVAYVPRSYFGNGVLRSMANKAAYEKLRQFGMKRQEAEEKQKAELSLVPKESEPVGNEPLQNA